MNRILGVFIFMMLTALASAQTRTVETVMGPVEVPLEPKRVVTLDIGELDAALILGVKPVGSVTTFADGQFPEYLEGQTEGIEIVGTIGEPSLEKITALGPDLILSNLLRNESTYEQLSAIAPTVFAEELGAGWQDAFDLYAEALGKAEEGERIVADYHARLDALNASLGARADTMTVSMIRFLTGDTARVYQTGSYIGRILQDAGLRRPESQQLEDETWTELNKELLGDADGSVIFYGVYGQDDETPLADFESDPLWSTLGAVQNGQVFRVPDEYWYVALGYGAANRVIDDLERYLSADAQEEN
jgi:iron complex transport system substrate-binding protein